MPRTLTAHADPAGSPPWPLAVGVLLPKVDGDVAAQADRRLGLALGAYRLGYYLLDLLEVDPEGDARSAASGWVGAWARVEDLVARSGADALVIAAPRAGMQFVSLPDRLAALPLRLVAA